MNSVFNIHKVYLISRFEEYWADTIFAGHRRTVFGQSECFCFFASAKDASLSRQRPIVDFYRIISMVQLIYEL